MQSKKPHDINCTSGFYLWFEAFTTWVNIFMLSGMNNYNNTFNTKLRRFYFTNTQIDLSQLCSQIQHKNNII